MYSVISKFKNLQKAHLINLTFKKLIYNLRLKIYFISDYIQDVS